MIHFTYYNIRSLSLRLSRCCSSALVALTLFVSFLFSILFAFCFLPLSFAEVLLTTSSICSRVNDLPDLSVSRSIVSYQYFKLQNLHQKKTLQLCTKKTLQLFIIKQAFKTNLNKNYYYHILLLVDNWWAM